MQNFTSSLLSPGLPDLYGSFATAKRICGRCEVVAECRAFADKAEGNLPASYISGFLGGESPRQRARRRGLGRAL